MSEFAHNAISEKLDRKHGDEFETGPPDAQTPRSDHGIGFLRESSDSPRRYPSRYSRAVVRRLITFGSVSSASCSRIRPFVRSGILLPFFVTSVPIAPECQEFRLTVYESEIHHGRLYPNLDTLVEKGLVNKGELDRRTKFYELTKRGRRELEARREWENEYVDLEC